MKKVIQFLRRLQANNNREWFHAHKEEFLEAQGQFNAFAQELMERIAQFDETVKGLTLADCTYRIYRDIRFSKDKSPYKTHFGVYVCRGGKKSGYSGYYFHIGVGEGDSYPEMHMLAVGDYCCDAKVLKIIREDIEADPTFFSHLMETLHQQGFHLDNEYQLKRVPKGFDPDSPVADFLKYKVYCLMKPISMEFVTAPNLAERVADLCKPTKPFLDFVNRAIQYAREEE